MKSQLLALLQNVFQYLILSISNFGWGSLLTHVMRINVKDNSSISLRLWLGWCTTLLVFQIVHLFSPITAYVSGFVYVIGILLSGKHLVEIIKRMKQESKITLKLVLSIVFVLVMVVWITARSMLLPMHYDSGLYHFNTIRWINSYRIIPGLGNLHGRLAFNQSFFTYTAALNFYPFFNQGRTIANSFLYFLTLATLIEHLVPVFKNLSTLLKSHPFKFLPSIFALPYMGYLAFSSNGFASPSPDLASILLQLTIFVILLRWISDTLEGQKDLFLCTYALTILAATSITIKLSNLIFAIVIIVLVIGYEWRKVQHGLREILLFMLPSLLIGVIWILRGYFLSGVPFYPSMIGYLPFDWAVPPSWVDGEAKWIYSWARQPNTIWYEVLGNWRWFKPWLSRIFSDFVGVSYPIFLSVLFLFLAIIVDLFKRAKRLRCEERAMVIPVISALIFWFFSAPDPRFAHVLFYLLALCMMMLFVTCVQKTVSKKFLIALISIVFLVGNFHYFRYFVQHAETVTDISVSGYYPLTVISYITKETQSGLIVSVPESGDQCWDTHLICTPYFSPALELREPMDITSGFKK